MRQISAYSNPTIKFVRDLRDKRRRRIAGQFMAEGLRILTEARDAGVIPRLLLFSAGKEPHPLVQTLIDDVELDGGDVIATTPQILSKISGKDNPQTVVGVYNQSAIALDTLDRDAHPIWLVAERLRDPGNLGTILRTADAVGAGGLILIGECVDPFSVEAVRASMGAIFTVPVYTSAWPDFTAWLRSGPGQLVGLSLDAETDYRGASYVAPTFILTGNEAHGMPSQMTRECDQVVKIPMHGKADSLNAAVATAVMAYEVLARL